MAGSRLWRGMLAVSLPRPAVLRSLCKKIALVVVVYLGHTVAAAEQSGVVLTGVPSGPTNSNPVIGVSAPNGVAYKYSINGGPYSEEIPIQTPISLSAAVHIGGRMFAAGSRELFDFINQRTDSLVPSPFIGSIGLENVQSQVQLTYLVNRIRTALLPENVLSLRGAGVGTLEVSLQETVPPGAQYELSALAVTGGWLSRLAPGGAVRTFSLALPSGATSITLVPQVNNGQTAITVNGQAVSSGAPVVLPAPSAGSSIALQTTGPGGVANYSIEIVSDDTLDETVHRSFYLRAFDPATAYVRIRNAGASVVTYGLSFNERFGLTSEDIVREIQAMAPEYSNEPLARKVWRFIRDNRVHSEPLTAERWFSSTALSFNSLGFGFCDDSADLFASLMAALGQPSRVWYLG